jgi:ribosome-associated toxin RatA of RatAB toxin-antitoxin module
MKMISNQIEMSAPPKRVFEVVSDLASWPRYLPHYRWIRVMEHHPDHLVVRMACYRGMIPIDWVSRFHTDPDKNELQFDHLKAFTRGMKVIWNLEPLENGSKTRVTIHHELDPVVKRWGNFFAQRVVGQFFIDYVATRTLRNFAKYFSNFKENQNGKKET